MNFDLIAMVYAAPFVLGAVAVLIWFAVGFSVDSDDPHQDPDNFGRH